MFSLHNSSMICKRIITATRNKSKYVDTKNLRYYSSPSSKAFFSKLFDDDKASQKCTSSDNAKSSSSFVDGSFYELLRNKTSNGRNSSGVNFNSRSKQLRINNNNNNNKTYNSNGYLRRGADGVPIFASNDLPEGSFKEIECFKHIIKKIYKDGNRDGLIQFMDIDSNKSDIPKVKFDKLLKNHQWNLKEYGLQVVSYSPLETKQHNHHKKGPETLPRLPLVKVVPKRTAMDKYNAELSKIKDEEIAMVNPRMAYIIQQKNSSNNATSTSSSSSSSSGVGMKLIKIGWSISDSDLTGKKFSEIISAAKKAALVVVVIDDKDSLHRAVEPEDLDFTTSSVAGVDAIESTETTEAITSKRKKLKPLNELELLKREKTLSLISTLLENSDDIHCNNILKKGSLRKRLLIKMKINRVKENRKKSNKENSDNSVSSKSEGELDLNDESLDIMAVDLNTIQDKKLLKEVRKRQRKEKERLREEKKKNKMASA